MYSLKYIKPFIFIKINLNHFSCISYLVKSMKNKSNVKHIFLKWAFFSYPGIVFWSIVNNAGLNFLGDIELTTMKQFEKVCDVNIMGMVRVTKTFLPWLRKSKGKYINLVGR